MGKTGYTTKTKENLLLDSGVWYKNYDVSTDTPVSAKSKIIGATEGGGSFTAKATYRNIKVDGVHADVKNMTRIDKWDVEMAVNTLEVTPETLAMALGASIINTGDAKHTIIKGKMNVDEADYADNITFIGTISGKSEPIIIQVLNALCVDGLTLDTKDNGEAVVALKFKGHADENTLDVPPYTIYYPKATAPASMTVKA